MFGCPCLDLIVALGGLLGATSSHTPILCYTHSRKQIRCGLVSQVEEPYSLYTPVENDLKNDLFGLRTSSELGAMPSHTSCTSRFG